MAYVPDRRKSGQSKKIRIFLMLIVIVAVIVLLRGRIFSVRNISVSGNSAYTAEQIAALAAIQGNANIFQLDENVIRQRIESDAHLVLVQMNKHYPDSVELVIRERKPVASIGCAGVILLVDQEGYILERRDQAPDGVTRVTGMEVVESSIGRKITSSTYGQADAMLTIIKMLCEKEITSLVSELNVENPDNLYLVAKTGVKVVLGDDQKMSEKLIWFQTVLERLTGEGLMSGVLDVSSGKNAVYTRPKE